MSYSLTPAVSRALEFAAGWSAEPRPEYLDLPEVLLGLLAEPECRAATMLARFGVSPSTVLAQWPKLREVSLDVSPRPFSPQLNAVLATALDLLWEYPQPMELATEHLLLGMVAQQDECAIWLSQRGFDAANLEGEVHRLAGHTSGPVELDAVPFLESSSQPDTATTSVESKLDLSPLRILDAAANRASEGLRVVEDYVRFVTNDRELTWRIKVVRHKLSAALAEIPWPERLSARDTVADVGTTVSTAAEYHRMAPADVAAASFQRVEQALRSLEEYGKLISMRLAQSMESLRYETYDIHKRALGTANSVIAPGKSLRERLQSARLYVLLDGCGSLAQMIALAKEIIAAGVHVIQLRDKHLSDRDLLIRAKTLRELTANAECLLVMNDRPDLAKLAQADGVHVGQDELPITAVRQIVGAELLVGLSTHSVEQAREAVALGADYIGIGPTFPSKTKHFDNFTGLDLVRAVSQEITLPTFAIGGIDTENLPQVLLAGCNRVAVGAAIIKADRPGEAVKALLRIWR
jgi:thiamine-phosphate pyrophosphorylase